MDENKKKPETIKHKIFRYIRNIVLVGLFLVIAWPAVYFPQKFQVLDYDTGELIADALVFVEYLKYSRMDYLLKWVPAPHGLGGFPSCFELLLTNTNQQGYFEAPFKMGFFGALYLQTRAYKQGYRHKEEWLIASEKEKKNTIYLVKDLRSSTEKIHYIEHRAFSILCGNTDQQHMLDKYCYFEMKKIAEKPEDFQKLKDFERFTGHKFEEE